MFGGVNQNELNEDSMLIPKSPYAAGKVFAHHMTQIYRDLMNCFVLTVFCSIMNHL